MVPIIALQSTLQGALTFHSLHIASIVVKMLSMSLALGPVARFMTRNLYESRYAWCDRSELSPPVRRSWSFGSSCLHTYNSQLIWHTPPAVRVVYSDASDKGYSGYGRAWYTCGSRNVVLR